MERIIVEQTLLCRRQGFKDCNDVISVHLRGQLRCYTKGLGYKLLGIGQGIAFGSSFQLLMH